MEQLDALQTCYRNYLDETKTLTQNKKLFDGVLGFGHDPRKAPCHEKFYQDVSAEVERLKGAQISADDAAEALRFMIRFPQENKDNQSAYYMMIAAHGPAAGLVPTLTKEAAAELAALYDHEFPKRSRLPVQEKLMIQLRKAGGVEGKRSWFRRG